MQLFSREGTVLLCCIAFFILLLVWSTLSQHHQAESLGNYRNFCSSQFFHPFCVICVPTVKRPKAVDYVPLLIESFLRICTSYQQLEKFVHHLFIYQLDDTSTHYTSLKKHSEALKVCKKKIHFVRRPSCHINYSTSSYYHWRCKEALDYAKLLQFCDKVADPFVNFLLVLQDDTVLTADFASLPFWLDEQMKRAKWLRACSISLYDKRQRVDSGPLLSNNAVARIYPRYLVGNLSRFIKHYYREEPVDWLIERYCRGCRLSTFVKIPNPVVHIGNISKIRVKCNPDDTIGDLKKLIAAQTGTRPEKIRIQKWYTVYKDHISLADYEIHDGMGLELYYD
eukprot:jgi/Galph1/474/GphlegSOOS_G5268.1